MTNIFFQAREKFKPRHVKALFITEAPPEAGRKQYFYFEGVRRGDSLFLEMMKVLFSEEVKAFETIRSLRNEKSYFLERMQEEGYFLMTAADMPLPDKTAHARMKLYRENLPELIKSILEVAKPGTPVILISAVVFRAVGKELKASGFNVIHKELIEFPNSGQQINFRRKLRPLLQQNNLLPSHW